MSSRSRKVSQENREAGQLLMMGLAGPKLKPAERKFIEEVQPAGFIYFRRNIQSPGQLLDLSCTLDSFYPTAFPPLIGIDEEGGMVSRLRPPFTFFPGNDYLGRYFQKRRRVDLLRAQVAAQAAELRLSGINLNFAPVADVNSNPTNPIIGRRSFGPYPKKVAQLVGETIRTYEKEGILSCAKHFPGHGDTHVDSHIDLPKVRASRQRLMAREIAPFRSAIAAHVPLIMTAHVLYSSWDRRRPATLSPFILDDLLRRRLKFKGVVVSDDLEMGAIARRYEVPAAAEQAVAAGVDLLIVSKSLSLAKAVVERLAEARREGRLSPSRWGQAQMGLRRVRRRVAASPVGHGGGKRTPSGWPRHRELAKLIEDLGR